MVGPVDRPDDARASADQPADAGAVEPDLARLESMLAEESTAAEAVRADLEDLKTQLQERTADVQRLQAEYVNYRKRVDRDRDLARDAAIGSVMTDLLTVLDDIDRADEHGELVGGFRSVADALLATLTKLGLQRYGEIGDAFDPTVHEALTHSLSGEVREPTCAQVFQPGYRFGDRVLRPARVAVVEPDESGEGHRDVT